MLSKSFLFAAAACALAATAASAQTAAPGSTVIIVPAKDLAAKLAVPPATPGAPVSAAISTAKTYRAMEAHRTADGVPELHQKWIDVMVMLKGDITLTYGGKIEGGTIDANGESHDGKIVGGTTVELHPGDYLEVPAGLPHQMTKPRNDFQYFIVKVPAAS